MDEIKLYTTKEVQDILKVTQRTMYRYIKAGKLKAIKLGKTYRISQEALEAFLAERTL